MSNSIYDQYLPKTINSSNSYQNMMNPYFPIPQNFNSFKEIYPYMHYQLNENYTEQFSSYNPYQDQKNNDIIESPIKSTTIDDSKDKILPKKIEKEKGYIDLLVNTVNKLFEKGDITFEYLNTKTKPKFDPIEFNLALNNLNENKEKNFCKKCDNKICTYLADEPNKLFKAKFISISSHKPKNLWLCEKCYKAYTLDNYCYYCHIIYREYEHGTQYYDKKKWIQCDYCNKWHHTQCEEKKGKFENIEELSMNINFKYMCPFCRKEHESIMRQKHKSEKMKKNFRKNKNENFLSKKRKDENVPLNELVNINNDEFNESNKVNKYYK